MDRLGQIAQLMLDQHKLKQNFQNLPKSLMPKDFDEAYKIQQIFQRNSGRGDLGGFKIALASRVQQELCGIDHPIAGGIFANEIKTSPAIFELHNFHGLGLEFEIAVTLSDDLKPEMGPFNNQNIRKFIKSLSPAFELIIDRDADYSNINPLSMIKLPTNNPSRTRRLLHGEYEALKYACKQNLNPWFYPLFILAIETGMRRSDLLSIEWQSININNSLCKALYKKIGKKELFHLVQKLLRF